MKENTKLKPVSYYTTETNTNTGATTNVSSGSLSVAHESLSDVISYPLVRRPNLPHNYHARKSSISNGKVKGQFYASSFAETYYNGPCTFPTEPNGAATARQNALAQATSELINSLAGSTNLAVSTVELGQTLRMLASPMKSIAKLATALVGKGNKPERSARSSWVDRPLNINRAQDISGSLADVTLEFNLGVKPLLYDMYSIAGGYLAVGDYGKTDNTRTVIQVQGKGHDSRDDVVKSDIFSTPLSPRAVAKCERLYEAHASCKAIFGINPTQLLAMRQRYVNLSPSAIAWELVPLSFVVDYVYDIGSYLHNNQQIAQYQSSLISYQVQELRVLSNMFSSLPFGNYPDITSGLYGFTGSGFSKSVRYSRAYPAVVLQPKPVTRTLDQLSKSQWSNVAALIAKPFCR